MIKIGYDNRVFQRKINLVETRIKVESPLFAEQISWKLALNIKNAINLRHPKYVGEYHNKFGMGLSKAIQSVKIGKNQFVVRVNPYITSKYVARPNGKQRWVKAPALYVGYVENGTYRSQPKHYFQKGFIKSAKDLNEDIEQFKQKIIR